MWFAPFKFFPRYSKTLGLYYCPKHDSRFILPSCHLASIRLPPSTLEAGRAASCWESGRCTWDEAPTLIELWIESLKTYGRLTFSTVPLLYKLIFLIHRPSQLHFRLAKLGAFKLRGNISPAKLCRTLKRTPESFPKHPTLLSYLARPILNSLDGPIKSLYTIWNESV